MIDPVTVAMLKQTSFEERIKIIEFILESLKDDIKQGSKTGKTWSEQFKVHEFSLGEEVHLDRDQLYYERGL